MSMKISNETVQLLKNFSTINNSIMLRNGEPLSTISEAGGIYAKAMIAENFPENVAIYDLSEFLSTLSLFNSPVLEFSKDTESEFVTIREEKGRASVRYRFTDVNNITYPEEELEIPSVDAEFSITKDQLSSLQKACSVMQLEDIGINADGQSITLVATDPKNKFSNQYELTVGETEKTFSHTVKAENLKLILSDYNVKISDEGMLEISNSDGSLTYLVALEEA